MSGGRDRWAASWRVLRKEVLETRRDRSLVLQLVLMPLLLYPLLGFLGIQMMMVSRGAAEKVATVVVLDADLPDDTRSKIRDLEGMEFVDAPSGFDRADAAIAAEDFRVLRQGWVGESPAPQLWVSWFRAATGDSIHILYDSSRDRSGDARRSVATALRSLQDAFRLDRASEVGLTEVDLEVWVYDDDDVSSSTQRGRWLLSLVLPMLLMFMLPQGTFYATLDTVVGERERGTWETVLTSPLSRVEILRGKLLYVVLWSLVAFLLNLVGMFVFVRFAISIIAPDAPIAFALTPVQLGIAFLAVVLLAFLLAAVMMVLASTARNYREGQALLTPVYMVAAFSGMFALFAGEDFSMQAALIPVVNVTSLLRAAFLGEIPLGPALITYAEILLLAVASVALASRLVRSESVLFDPEISVRQVLKLMRRSER